MLRIPIDVSCFFLAESASVWLSVCAHLFDDLWYRYMRVLASLHLWWPWANWRASLVEASECYGTWSVLYCAISWQGTVDNLSPWEPSHIISLSKPFVQDRGERHEKSTLQTNNTITPTPFLSPPHSTSKLFWDNGRPWTPLCMMLRGAQCRGWLCQTNIYKKGGCNTQVVTAVVISDTANITLHRPPSKEKDN